MNDRDFINWLRDRLINVYNESPNVDFVQRLDDIKLRADNPSIHTYLLDIVTSEGAVFSWQNLANKLNYSFTMQKSEWESLNRPGMIEVAVYTDRKSSL